MLKTIEERDKFCALYEEYRGFMYVIAYSIVRDPDLAEDVVHAALFSVAENIGEIGDPGCDQTRGCLATIVEQKALELLRIGEGKTGGETDGEAGFPVEHQGSVSIARCVMKLPAKYRAVLVLRSAHGFSYKAVADAMGISEEEAQDLEKQAKMRLADWCAESEGDKSPSTRR